MQKFGLYGIGHCLAVHLACSCVDLTFCVGRVWFLVGMCGHGVVNSTGGGLI